MLEEHGAVSPGLGLFWRVFVENERKERLQDAPGEVKQP